MMNEKKLARSTHDEQTEIENTEERRRRGRVLQIAPHIAGVPILREHDPNYTPIVEKTQTQNIPDPHEHQG